MQKRISIPLFFIGFFLISFAQAQVKIGDNPQVIDPSSILELESSDKVLVITRVDSEQMATIVPNRGALVYNTTADCVYYYDGTAWISMCEGIDGGALTALPIENDESTIVITPTADGNNIEIAPNSISSDQILNGGINGVDIQDGSIGRGKLAPNAVDKARIAENAVGPYAIDRDSLGLSFFNNDAGFITGANIVSADANNAIVIGSDGGALFDATTIETSIATNAAAIAADNDNSPTNELQTLNLTGSQLSISGVAGSVNLPTADGSDTKINPGNNVTIQGNGTDATPYVINATAVDGSVTNELTDLDFDLATNILSLSNGATVAGSSVNLSSLAGGGTTAQISSTTSITVAGDGSAATPYELTAVGGGGGSTEVADGTTITGIGTAGNPFKIEPSATTGQYLSTDATGVVWADLPPSGASALFDANTISGAGIAGDEYTVADGAISTDKIVDANVTPIKIEPSTTNGQYLSTDVTGAVVWSDLPPSGASALFDANTISGTGLIGNEYTVADDAINSAKIEDATIELIDINQNGAADGDVIRWEEDSTSWIVEAAPGEHSGTPMSLFYADATTGLPTTAFNSNNGDMTTAPSLIWDQSKRINSGALGIGIDGGPFGDYAKVQIMEGGPDALSFPLQIQKRSGAPNTASGILFAVDSENPHGKGSLAFERTGAWGVGDFHFLQNLDGVVSNPTLTDKSFSILSNKDIQLYGNVIAQNGPGAVGQVLTTDASGQTVWGTGGGSGTDEQNIEGSVLTDQLLTIGIENGTGQDVDLSSFATEVELTAAVAASAELPTGGASGNVLSTDGAGVYSWIAASGGLATVTTSASFTGDGTATSELDIANDVITTDELAIDAVIEENILDEAVTSAKIANNTIAIEDLSPMGADTDGQILKWNNTLTTWEIGTDDGAAASTPYTAGAGLDLSATNVFSVNDLVGDVTGPTSATVIATDAITADKIATGAVNTDEIAAGAVVTTSIANNNVTPDKISEGADGEVLTTDSSGDVVWAPVSGANLSTTNLTQTEVIRTYEIGTGQSLVFTGPGSVGFGNGANPPLDKFHFAGEVRVEGVNSAGGTVGAPAYSFSTSDDGNTGMFRPAADEIGFSVGGVEALHIEEDGNLTNVTVTGAFSTKIRRENSGGAITIADDDHTVIIISGTSVNLPAPAANTGKIYILKNSTGGPIPIDSYRTSNGIASINLNAVVLQLQSDGVEWQQIN